MSVHNGACIYAIVNVITGRHYIGSTATANIRYLGHRSDLNNGTHSNKYLQNSWNYHGASAFVFVVIEISPPKPLIKKAQRVPHWKGRRFSDEHREALRAAWVRRKARKAEAA